MLRTALPCSCAPLDRRSVWNKPLSGTLEASASSCASSLEVFFA